MLLFYPMSLVYLFVHPALFLKDCHTFPNTERLSASSFSPYFVSTLSYCTSLFLIHPYSAGDTEKLSPTVRVHELVNLVLFSCSHAHNSLDSIACPTRQAGSCSGIFSRNVHSVICMFLFLSCESNRSVSPECRLTTELEGCQT